MARSMNKSNTSLFSSFLDCGWIPITSAVATDCCTLLVLLMLLLLLLTFIWYRHFFCLVGSFY